MLIQQISLTLLLFLVPLQVACIAQENSTTPEIQCNASSTPPSTRFRFYLGNKILALQTASRSKHFYYTMGISDQFIPILYASFLCRGDVNSTRCFECVSRATEAAQKYNCVNTSTQAVVWRDVCMFRYSNLAFSGRRDESPAFVLNNETVSIPASVNATQLDEAVKGAAGAIATKLGSSSEPNYGIKYATVAANVSGDDQIYAMGECTWDLIPDECRLCVHDCASKIPGGKVGGRVMFPSCNFRFEMYRFYDHGVAEEGPGPQGGSPRRPNPRAGPVPSPTSNLTSNGSTGSQPGGRKMAPPKWKRPSHAQDIAGFGSSLAVILLIISGALFFAHRRKKNKQASQDMDEITSADSLQLEFSKIRSATHNFAADKKLGQGGFGEVYKGKFENGQVIAVKRLSRDSKQGITEFKTEILLVANLQHRNLVKLLGFCFSGKEKILVYEYLSNSSLDRLLFDPIKREALNWETRFGIISGIAKGLLYLHEDSRLKIIHRDLKTSNILLDDFMNPKISDFGMAKLFGVDQTRDATKTIVGTYGYMAPEYMLTGQYSVKSDIYSFGIIVLEMITGIRNTYMSRPLLEEALLHRAWRLWNEGSALELVDYVLGDAYSREEVIKCIHIGLLCIQEDASRRPQMTWVVAAIRDETNHFPAPTPPNFFNSIRRSASGSGSGSSTDPGACSSTGGETLTDVHGR